MEVNISKLTGAAIGIVSLILVGYVSYFLFTLFFTGVPAQVEPSLSNLNSSIFGSKVQVATAALTDGGKKILVSKKDLAFIEGQLYKSFTDSPEDVPLSDSRGRPDPFIPYVAP